MAAAALRLPFLSEADPEQSGEGSLDPLGLASLADRLADEIAPGITARMSRIRFVTAISVGAVATEKLSDAVAAERVELPEAAARELALRLEVVRYGGDGPGERSRSAPSRSRLQELRLDLALRGR
jgi:hypothetical protein